VLSHHRQRGYNYYNRWAALVGSWVTFKVVQHFLFQTEYE
jgi:hypothetical protein